MLKKDATRSVPAHVENAIDEDVMAAGNDRQTVSFTSVILEPVIRITAIVVRRRVERITPELVVFRIVRPA
jgi:hypothetical protein